MTTPVVNFAKRIVLFTDSQGLPRHSTWGALPCDSTFPWMVHDLLRRQWGPATPMVLERAKRERTIEDVLADWVEDVDYKKPEIVVISVGGSDCAPRVFAGWDRAFWKAFPIGSVRARVLNWELAYRRKILALGFRRSYVSPARFRRCLEEIVDRSVRCHLKRLILLNIPPVSDKLESMCPGARERVRTYNAIYDDFRKAPGVTLIDACRLIDERGGTDKLTFEGVHLKKEGQALLAEQIVKRIHEAYDLPEEAEYGGLFDGKPADFGQGDHPGAHPGYGQAPH